MANSPGRVALLSSLGILGAVAAIASILFVGDTFGFPGTSAYRIYENFNRLMAIFIALQTCALLGFYFQHGSALRRVGRAAFFLAVLSWISMAFGTAAEFWLYSDLPYGQGNMRDVAFSVFSISTLLGGLALMVLGFDLLLSRALPRYFAVIMILYLALDIVFWIMGQSVFLATALVSLAFGGMALRGSSRMPLSDRQPAPLPRQLLAILVGFITASAANVIFYLLVTGLLGVPMVAPEQFPPPQLSPILVSDVVLFSFIFSLGAGLVFLFVANLSRRPAPIYLGISLVVLVISLFLPFRMPRPPVPISTPVVLASMHVIGAALLVPILIAVGLPVQRTKS